MTDVTRAEYCAVAIADCFADDGEVMGSPMGLLPSLGARLAKHTSNPLLMITDGESRILQGAPPLGVTHDVVEGWMPFRLVLESVVSYGKRHVIMGATQIDREGNQNISAIGDWARPKRQLLGVRGAPGNTVNNKTSYWVPKHSARVFVDHVDVVSGVGRRAPRLLVPLRLASTRCTAWSAISESSTSTVPGTRCASSLSTRGSPSRTCRRLRRSRSMLTLRSRRRGSPPPAS